jgi:hypothetical protein
MASCCTHPIDQQKYRMQVQKGKLGMLPSICLTVRNAGEWIPLCRSEAHDDYQE